ncbi:hypothetical protein C8J57DRAFT_1234104 [Mycena rebaudengoi]|nr:hypothetical protein C8J57DRAFT_1234104 [Mycena rebaudengoi]
MGMWDDARKSAVWHWVVGRGMLDRVLARFTLWKVSGGRSGGRHQASEVWRKDVLRNVEWMRRCIEENGERLYGGDTTKGDETKNSTAPELARYGRLQSQCLKLGLRHSWSWCRYGDEGEIVQIWKGHISGLMGYIKILRITPNHIEDALSAVSEKLAVYDIILAKQKFIGGNVTCLRTLQKLLLTFDSLYTAKVAAQLRRLQVHLPFPRRSVQKVAVMDIGTIRRAPELGDITLAIQLSSAIFCYELSIRKARVFAVFHLKVSRSAALSSHKVRILQLSIKDLLQSITVAVTFQSPSPSGSQVSPMVPMWTDADKNADGAPLQIPLPSHVLGYRSTLRGRELNSPDFRKAATSRGSSLRRMNSNLPTPRFANSLKTPQDSQSLEDPRLSIHSRPPKTLSSSNSDDLQTQNPYRPALLPLREARPSYPLAPRFVLTHSLLLARRPLLFISKGASISQALRKTILQVLCTKRLNVLSEEDPIPTIIKHRRLRGHLQRREWLTKARSLCRVQLMTTCPPIGGVQELTLVDLFHLYYAPWFAAKGVEVMTTSGSNVARWWNELIRHPTWVKLKEIEAEANK